MYTQNHDRCKKFQYGNEDFKLFCNGQSGDLKLHACTRKNLIHYFTLGATFKTKMHLQNRYQIDQSSRKKGQFTERLKKNYILLWMSFYCVYISPFHKLSAAHFSMQTTNRASPVHSLCATAWKCHTWASTCNKEMHSVHKLHEPPLPGTQNTLALLQRTF